MLAFDVAAGAVGCAVDLQRRLAQRDSDPPLRVRIGMNTGEPVTKGADLFGAAVNLASRLCDRAEAGSILVSDAVRSDSEQGGFRFGDPQPMELKGFTNPVLACRVLWDES